MIKFFSNQKIAFFIFFLFTFSLLETSPKIETDSSSMIFPVKKKETFITIDSIGTNTPAPIPTREETSHYNISVVFDPSARTATGWINVSYLNTEAITFNELYFHIWPKYYSSDAIVIDSIMDRTDVLLNYEIENTVNLRVDLLTSIQSQERGIIRIQFTTKLPTTLNRFGSSFVNQLSGYLYAYTNWHPILSVYENGAWNKNPFFNLGEGFYADVGHYRVNITAPMTKLLAGAGDLQSIVKKGEFNEYFWTAGPIREFSWFASDKWKVVSKEHKNVNISSFHYPNHEEGANKSLDVVINCIDLFSELFEPFPYKSVAIIESPNALEYGQAIMISEVVFPDGAILKVGEMDYNLERLIVHEFSHTWNTYIVGNNPYNEPWLDEGWAQFSEYLYTEKYLGQEIADRDHFFYKNKIFIEFSKTFIDDTPLIMSADYYLNLSYPQTYYLIAYGKGTSALHQLRFILGDTKFFNSLEVFYETFSYKTITTEDFKQVFEQTSNMKLDWFFDQYVYNKGYPEYSITSSTYSEITGNEIDWQMEIEIKQEQPDLMINLVPITIEFENTSSSQILKENYKVWVNQSTETIQFDIPADYRPIRMQLDPDWYLFRENTTIESLFTKSTSTPGWTSLPILMSSMLMVLLRNRKLKKKR
jgi:hypothetical protein